LADRCLCHDAETPDSKLFRKAPDFHGSAGEIAVYFVSSGVAAPWQGGTGTLRGLWRRGACHDAGHLAEIPHDRSSGGSNA